MDIHHTNAHIQRNIIIYAAYHLKRMQESSRWSFYINDLGLDMKLFQNLHRQYIYIYNTYTTQYSAQSSAVLT